MTHDLQPYVLAVAPNGARRTAADHPALPVTARELARTAAEIADAGATMMHVHVRDRDGGHVLDADLYREALVAIRGEIGDRMVLQITTEAVGRYQPQEQMAVALEVRPEAVSLALRELCGEAEQERAFATFMGDLRALHIAPQIILYDAADVQRLASLTERDVLSASGLEVLYVLGRYAADQESQPGELLPFLHAAGARFPAFMVCAFGWSEAASGVTAVLLGGGVRVGFENNLYLPDGSRAPDNAALARAVGAPLEALGYRPQSADRLRAIYAGRRG
ncbi:MAG: 3-keto-5-aminohexanoate cleavage protein [Alphaproteobacteria bacterium]